MNVFSKVLVLAALLPALPLHAADRALVGDVADGSRLFAIHCTACHGVDGQSDGMVQTTPAASNLTDPARMNLLSDPQLAALLTRGGPAVGKSATMPAFGDALSDLEVWNIVAFLRQKHLAVTDFYPFAESYYGARYEIDKWGATRFKEVTGAELAPADRELTVLGIFQTGEQPPAGPRLIPDVPLELAKIDRTKKIGYLVFLPFSFPKEKDSHMLGLSLDKNGIIFEIKVNHTDPKTAEAVLKRLKQFEGQGHKGMKEPLYVDHKRDKELGKLFTQAYTRAMEAVVMYDKAERERHWADADFGGPKDPDVSVEGGELKVGDGKKKKRRR